MSSSTPEFLERFRQPEYTGENRCTPCTIVNSAIAVALAATVGAALAVGVSPLAGSVGGLAVLAGSALSIALRGYLVPGTPTLTKRHFPDRVLAWFEKEPAAVQEAGAIDEAVDETDGEGDDRWDVEISGERVEQLLQEAGALEECERVDDLCVTEDYRTVWWRHIEATRDSDDGREQLAHVLDADPDELEFEEHGGSFMAKQDMARIGKWESEAAFLADMGAARALEEVAPEHWGELNMRERSAALNGVRVFLERCPVCDGVVTLNEETVESCCREYDVMAVSCDDCGARLFEHQDTEHYPHP